MRHHIRDKERSFIDSVSEPIIILKNAGDAKRRRKLQKRKAKDSMDNKGLLVLSLREVQVGVRIKLKQAITVMLAL
ncbi:unnamed protein product [Linum trigynum]|uniref:Uncharacterized protein n=1 Tax=Linum trigynum TaxID=586398 RepID=A0AAV2EBM0_9ROSI